MEVADDQRASRYGANCTVVLTIAPRSSVMATNQVLASAGGLGAVIVSPFTVAGTLVHFQAERSPWSVV